MIIKVALASGDCSKLERVQWQKAKIVLTLMVQVGECWRYSSACEGMVQSSRLTSCFVCNFQPLSIHLFTIRMQEKSAWSETAWKTLWFYLSGNLKRLVNEQWTDSLLIDQNSSDVCAWRQNQYAPQCKIKKGIFLESYI